jgi:hypothetical protein
VLSTFGLAVEGESKGRLSGRAVLGDSMAEFDLGVIAPCKEGEGVRVSGCNGGNEFLG